MKLFKHQEEALEQTKYMNRVAYYLDMGLGKTFVGSEKLVQLESKLNLVICQKSKIQDWIEHFESYYSKTHVIYNLTNKGEFIDFLCKVDDKSKIGIINYELAWRRKNLLQLSDDVQAQCGRRHSSNLRNEKGLHR